MRDANGVPEMPYGYWKVAQLLPDYGPDFLVAMDLQDWTDEHVSLFASGDQELRKAHTDAQTRSSRKEQREATRLMKEGAISKHEWIAGRWRYGGEDGKRGKVWETKAATVRKGDRPLLMQVTS